MHIDQNYNKLLRTILNDGSWYGDPNRKGVNRLEIPSYTFRHEFKDGFPVISTKKLYFKSVITELAWFLKGDTNIKYLVDNGCNIWNKDAYKHYLNKLKPNETPVTIERFIEVVKTLNEDYIKPNRHKLGYVWGDLGPVYGHQWVNATKIIPTGSGHYTKKTVNQIQELIKNMIEKPMSSELIVNAWNPVELDEMALQPCHYGFQIVMKPLTFTDLSCEEYIDFRRDYVTKVGDVGGPKISMKKFYENQNYYKYGFELHWNQRSCDSFLGIPFNIASYATLALILQALTGHKALAIQGDLKKVHLYDNSIDGAKEQILRESNLKKVEFNDNFWFESTDLNVMVDGLQKEGSNLLNNYEPHPAIKVEMLERT